MMTFPIMRCFICGLLIFSAFAWADERKDRAAIQGIIDVLNDDRTDGSQQRVLALFTNDADNQIERLSDLDRRLAPARFPQNPTSPGMGRLAGFVRPTPVVIVTGCSRS